MCFDMKKDDEGSYTTHGDCKSLRLEIKGRLPSLLAFAEFSTAELQKTANIRFHSSCWSELF